MNIVLTFFNNTRDQVGGNLNIEQRHRLAVQIAFDPLGGSTPFPRTVELGLLLPSFVVRIFSLFIRCELLDLLKEMDVRDRYPVIVGGGVTTQQWAERIGDRQIRRTLCATGGKPAKPLGNH